METLKHGNKEVHVCFESWESTCSMMKDAILPCFDICHMLSVYTHTLTNGICWFALGIVFSSIFPIMTSTVHPLLCVIKLPIIELGIGILSKLTGHVFNLFLGYVGDDDYVSFS